MKISKFRFAAVGILLGTSGLVVSCGGGDAVTPVSEPQPPTQRGGDIHDGSEPCIPPVTEDLGLKDDEVASPQLPPSQPRRNSGSGNAQALHDDAGCILPELEK
jgi:hypothetical protein